MIADSETHQTEVIGVGDTRAQWPPQTGIELFDIATVCLTSVPKRRPEMDQVIPPYSTNILYNDVYVGYHTTEGHHCNPRTVNNIIQ